jgi:hypothetical protein
MVAPSSRKNDQHGERRANILLASSSLTYVRVGVRGGADLFWEGAPTRWKYGGRCRD